MCLAKEPYNVPCQEDQPGYANRCVWYDKLRGEQKIMTVGCKHVIIRYRWLYSEFGKNFCKTMMHLTATRPQLKVVFDPGWYTDIRLRFGENAIAAVLRDYATDIACAIYGKSGIYHYSNEGVCSWFDFTKMIAEYNGTTACDIRPCHSDEFPSPVKRPSYLVLDKTKIKETFGVRVPYWTESLKRCITNLKNNC